MRLTIGPLPPGVYWRRRALVLGVLVLVGFLVAYIWTGSTRHLPPGPLGDASMASQTPTVPATSSSATQSPTPDPTVTTSSPTEPPVDPTTAVGGGLVTTQAPQSATGPCTNQEILLTATASPVVLQIGQSATLTLTIKNISQRTCDRDIGSIPQELQLRHGDTVVWSSDVCSGSVLYDYNQVFTPGYEKSFPIAWNGYRNEGGSAQQPCLAIDANLPAAGTYQVVARLGTLFSQPATVTIHAAP
jgi:hypothetical protein